MRFAILLTMFVGLEVGAEPSVSHLWKARALEAADKTDTLTKQIEALPAAKDAERKKLAMQRLVEAAYMAHAVPKLEGAVHKKEGNAHIFHFILNYGKEAGLFDLAYVYGTDGKLAAARIDLLPKGARLISMASLGESHFFLSFPGQPTVFLSLVDPFKAEATD